MGLVPIKSQKQAVTFSGGSLLFFGENLSYYKAFFDIIRGRKVTDKTMKKVLLLLLFICNSLIINDYLFLKFVTFSFFDLFIFRTLVSL
jgi:hypothetical protein